VNARLSTDRRLAFAAVILLICCECPSRGQTSAFTYQGRLSEQNKPANGDYDLAFRLMDAATNGNPVGPLLIRAPVAVADGLFSVSLDFGDTVFTGNPLWLQIGVRTNGTASPYTLLNPLQPVATAPYATFANRAATADMAINLTPNGLLSGNGAGIRNLIGANIALGTISSNQIDPGTDAIYRSGAALTLAFSTPQQFGAKGDGVTDDTAALQNWITDASVATKSALLPPAPGGFYKITHELTVPNGIHLAGGGGGKHATSGPYTSKSHIRQFTPGQNGLHLLNAIDSIHIDNVVISAAPPGNYTNACCGIFFDGGAPDSDCSILEQVLVMGFGTGVNIASAADSSFRACSFGWNGTGVAINGVANNITLESCQLSYNYGHQVYADSADNLIIKGCDIAAETPESQGLWIQNNVALILIGSRFEDYSTNAMMVATSTYGWGPWVLIEGTGFYNYSHSSRYQMAMTNCYLITLINHRLDDPTENGIVVQDYDLDGHKVRSVPPQKYRYIPYPWTTTVTNTASIGN
jgi:hypothetical protein